MGDLIALRDEEAPTRDGVEIFDLITSGKRKGRLTNFFF